MSKLTPDCPNILRILRADVPRPNSLPNFCNHKDFGKKWRWKDCSDQLQCPLGLHKLSVRKIPASALDFAGSTLYPSAAVLRKNNISTISARYGVLVDHVEDEFWKFVEWWDELTEPELPGAMDFIWPPAPTKAAAQAGEP